MTPHIN